MDSNSNSNKVSELQPSIIAKRDENDDASVLVSVQPPQGNKRTPVDICCVVDVSGSMNDQATLQNSSGQSEAHGLSLLDVVKHAVKTVIHVMQPQDRLSVVSFHTNAKVEIELTDMNDKGKKKAEDIVTGLQPLNSTNLWDGLLHGLEVLRKGQEKNEGRMAAVLLLTDGQPNVEPEGGHLGALKKYKDEHKSLNATINCFGFGYNMNSQLLNDLSVEGNGMYAFIPDSGFVGTSFVNATSNLLVTMARNVKISLEPQNGASIVSNGVLGGYPTQYNSWGALVNFDNLQYDQTKNVVVKMKIPKDLPSDKPYLAATVRFETATSTKPLEETVNGSIFQESPEVLVQKFRLETVKIIREATSLGKTDLNKAKGLVANLIREIKASEPTDPRVKALLQDLEGQVTEALSKSEYFNKWGVHYLPSLANAHLLQICNNFKDPGVQVYGGKLFQKLRDEADAIFIKLPPPKPSHKTTKAVSSMSYYHSSSAPCFAGQCQVLMPNGTTKRVDEIKKGDHVMTLAGKPAQVLCVVKTVSADGMTHLVELGAGLLITPFHPVKVGSRWDFPCNLGQVYNLPCDAVYSFVLKDEHVMIINGVTCVTLGHNFQEENVKHEYFGSQRIVEDLKKLNGWENGLVVLNSGCLVRDRNTKLVTGLKQQQVSV